MKLTRQQREVLGVLASVTGPVATGSYTHYYVTSQAWQVTGTTAAALVRRGLATYESLQEIEGVVFEFGVQATDEGRKLAEELSLSAPRTG